MSVEPNTNNNQENVNLHVENNADNNDRKVVESEMVVNTQTNLKEEEHKQNNNQNAKPKPVKKQNSFHIADIPRITTCLAVTVLCINIILPGIGTMILGCKFGGEQAKTFILTGLLQLLLAPCLIGWIWAIWASVKLVQMTCGNSTPLGAVNNMLNELEKMEKEMKKQNRHI